MRRRDIWFVVGICSVSLAPIRTVMGAEYSYTLGYTAEYSDNVRLVAPPNEEHELIHVLTGGFRFEHASRDVDARVLARAAYRDYRNGTFSDSALLGMDSYIEWKPLPDAFHWTVQDVYAQLLADPARADTPANRVNTNVLSTGPDLFWRLTSVHTLQLGGRYAISSFDATDDTATTSTIEADNTRRNVNLRWLYRPSPVTTYYVGGLTERVEFDDTGLSDANFRRNEVSVGLISTIARNSLTVDLGKTRIRQRNGNEFEGGSGRLSWVRVLRSDSSITLRASRALSDAAETLLTTSGVPQLPNTTTVSTSDLFLSKQISALYSQRSVYNVFELSLFRNEREFEISTLNNEEAKGVSIDFTHNYTDAFAIRPSIGYVESLFPLRPREDETATGSLAFLYRLSRTLTGSLAFARQERSSTDPGAEYTEDRVMLGLTYNTPVSRTARHVP